MKEVTINGVTYQANRVDTPQTFLTEKYYLRSNDNDYVGELARSGECWAFTQILTPFEVKITG